MAPPHLIVDPVVPATHRYKVRLLNGAPADRR
jgi:hypothetical protein